MQEPLGRGCSLPNVLGFTRNNEIHSYNYRVMSSPKLHLVLASLSVWRPHVLPWLSILDENGMPGQDDRQTVSKGRITSKG